MPEDRSATIVSLVPGRLRLRLDRSLRSPDTMGPLVETISGLSGVRAVEANPSTGSVLILYDPEAISLEDLYTASQAANLNVVVPGSSPTAASGGEVSEVARAINSSFGRVDGAIASFTGGKLDARTLVPLGLGAAAVRQLAVSGTGLSAIPWYVLLWYSFEMFTKYNLRKRAESRGPTEGE